MTRSKTYRRDYTIEPDSAQIAAHSIMWYKHTPDADNVHHCYTEEEAEREIDDAIITEQEAVIEKLKQAFIEVLSVARASRDVMQKWGITSDMMDGLIKKNEHLLNSLES